MRVLVLILASFLTGGPALALSAPEGMVVWASNREGGRHEIYRMKADGSDQARVTRAGGQYPIWSPDGSWIAYLHTDSTTHVIRWDGTEDRRVCEGRPVFWMHDNSGVVCAQPRADWPGWDGSRSDRFFVASPALGTSRLLFEREEFLHLRDGHGSVGLRHFTPGGITHDGRWLVAWVFGMFENGYPADNGTFQAEHASVVLDMRDKSKLYFLGPGCTTTTPPAGDLVFHVSRVGPTAPDVFSLSTNDVMSRASYRLELGNPDPDWGHEYFPRISNDNRWLSYGASDFCHDWHECNYDIFLHPLGGAPTERLRLTEHSANDNYPHLFVGPAWRPEAGAKIELVPNRLTLHGTSEQPPPERRVAIANAGRERLHRAEVKVLYDGAGGWLDVASEVLGTHEELVVRVKTDDLPSGVHVARVEVKVANAAQAVHVFPVRLEFVNTRPAPADAGAATGPLPPDAGAETPGDSGCTCAVGGRAGQRAWALAPLLLLAFFRRRVRGIMRR